MAITKEEVLGVFKETGRPVSMGEIKGRLRIKDRDKKAFRGIIDDLLMDGTIIKIKGGQFGLPKKMDLIPGTLTCHRDGYGFVIPDVGGDDVYLPPREMKEAMHGDKLLVRVESFKRGKKEGRVVRIVERGVTRVIGRYESERGHGFVVPEEQRILHDIYIPKGQAGGATKGEVVVAEIVKYPTSHSGAEGKVVEVLGRPDDPEVEVMSIVRKNGIRYEFPPEVLSEAKRVPQTIDPEEVSKRIDLRGMHTVTIDGEKAKDFDDAVAVRMQEDGNIRLWVSIADVSHYVREGSPLDREALMRGTSTYFLDRVIPMLPEELSNGICSLNPKVDRLTMTAEMLFDRSGNLKEKKFYPSVIHSVERLTYTAVRQVLVDKDREVMERYKRILDDLRIMEELCLRLRKKRMKRGAIDFDLPEPQIILDIEGKTEDIVKAERNLAHQVIEEFMLAANEAVASYISEMELPFIYRIHEPPDEEDFREFSEFVHNLGYTMHATKNDSDFKVPSRSEQRSGKDRRKGGRETEASPSRKITPMSYQLLLEEVKGEVEERLINTVMLRSMKQAKYSHENSGHFGLAAEFYTHFTSPIRRYPDLIVHRILKDVLSFCRGEALPRPERLKAGFPSERRAHWEARLPSMAESTSRLERMSMEAEREIVDLKKTQFMAEKIGEEFDGVISGVTSFGFFVELVDFFIEGLVHVSSLKGDYYHYEEKAHLLRGERTKRVFRIGDKLKVRVENVSIERREVDFGLIDDAPVPKMKKGGKKKKG